MPPSAHARAAAHPSSAGRASGARDRRGGHPRHRHAAATPPPRCASGSVEDVGGVEEDFFDAFALLAAEAGDAVAAAVAGARPFTRPLEVAAAPAAPAVLQVIVHLRIGADGDGALDGGAGP